MEIINYKNDKKIYSLDTWFKQCPPKGMENQWVEGYSAFELAKEYIDNGVNSLNVFDDVSKIDFKYAYPEYNTKFDSYGQGRVHDLLLIGNLDENIVVVSVEGKVNESFGQDTVSSYYMKSKIDTLNGVSTNKCKRMEEMLSKLYQTNIPKEIRNVRYQLITSLIGSLEEAYEREAKVVYLIFQVFKSESYDIKKAKLNLIEAQKLLRVLELNKSAKLSENKTYGPYIFKKYNEIKLYLGYTTTP